MPAPALPIDAHLSRLVQAILGHRVAVLVAPPGSGKTTRLPGALLDAGVSGTIVVLEPRRLAARAAARRVASERHVALGEEVGYQVRHDRCAGPHTRIRFVTEGVLVRRLVEDPLLDGVGVVVLDEFHERHLEGDLALAMLAEIRATVRPDLIVVAMSATLDVEPLRRFLGDCPVLAVDAPGHPVRVEYAARVDDRPWRERVPAAVAQAWAETGGDVLVFLPGVREIEACAATLSAQRQDATVLALHGRLTAEQQDRAVAPDPTRRKIVLATNIAESSLTIPGVTAVVDSGVARILRHDPARGLDTLRTERISRASAAQRSGRAGRTGPGVCYRLWTASEERAMPAFETAEVHRVDVAGAALAVAGFAGRSAAAFAWFDPPQPAALQRAHELLSRLGAVDQGGLTAIGRRMLRLPLHPRLARVMIEAERRDCTWLAASAAALISEREVLRGVGATPDLHERLELLQGRDAAFDVDRGALAAVRRARDQIAGQARRGGEASDADLVCSLLAGFPDRVAIRPGHTARSAVMVGGRALTLPADVPELGPLFLALRVGDTAERRTSARVFLAIAVEREWLQQVLPAALRTQDSVEFDASRGRVRALRRLCFEDLVLEQHTAGAPDPEAARLLLADVLARDPWPHLGRQDDLRRFLARLRWLRAQDADAQLPEIGDAEVARAAASLLVEARDLAELRDARVLPVLRAALPNAVRDRIEREAPDSVRLPVGRSTRIDYAAPAGPTVSARIQELFGLTETPRVGRGVPVVFEILAPNRRPVQVTSDLESFWREVYPKVRIELRRRYPKHAWPI